VSEGVSDMSTRQVTIIVHAITEDGVPDMTDQQIGRVAFIVDGCIVSGWPLGADPDGEGTYTGQWEADSDVGRGGPFSRMTHWVEFPEPIWDLEREQQAHRDDSAPDTGDDALRRADKLV